MVTTVTVTASYTKPRREYYYGSQGERLWREGRECLPFYRAPAPERPFSYTQTTVRLYAISNALPDDDHLNRTPKSPCRYAPCHEASSAV